MDKINKEYLEQIKFITKDILELRINSFNEVPNINTANNLLALINNIRDNLNNIELNIYDNLDL